MTTISRWSLETNVKYLEVRGHEGGAPWAWLDRKVKNEFRRRRGSEYGRDSEKGRSNCYIGYTQYCVHYRKDDNRWNEL